MLFTFLFRRPGVLECRSSFCINSPPDLPAHLRFFFFAPSPLCPVLCHCFLFSLVICLCFQESTSEIEEFFTFTPLPVCLYSLTISYIFTLTCIVYRPILYSPVSACLYLHLRQIIVPAQGLTLVFFYLY